MEQEPLKKKGIITSSIPAENATVYDMIVFSHLRWDFVYQRPQHVIHRMSEKFKILYVEEPVCFGKDEEKTADLYTVNDNLQILKPKVHSIADLKFVIPMYVANTTVRYGWFYSSAFVSLLNDISFDTVIYDCMDELTLFKYAPDILKEQETVLLSEADVVFTGGKSLYEAKKKTHDNVHCFPSSVDRAHFAQAMNGIALPDDLPANGKPVVGFYGVIDERIDLDLIKSIAEKMRDVDFVLIGPIAKIDFADLPKAANIHYPGMKSYNQLPHYLKGFDVAMMPFALNDATKFISPTKTLEFMAANKPIVSTAIYDVVRDYDHAVAVVATSEECCETIRTILNYSAEQKQSQLQIFEEVLNKTSWDKTVNSMQEIIKKQ